MSQNKYEVVITDNEEKKILKTIASFSSKEELEAGFGKIFKSGMSTYAFTDGIKYELEWGPPGLGILNRETYKIAYYDCSSGGLCQFFYDRRKTNADFILKEGKKS